MAMKISKMFKNKSYNQKKIIKIQKHIDTHNVKNVEIKTNSNNKNYEKIKDIVENNESEQISNPDVKHTKNKLNIV